MPSSHEHAWDEGLRLCRSPAIAADLCVASRPSSRAQHALFVSSSARTSCPATRTRRSPGNVAAVRVASRSQLASAPRCPLASSRSALASAFLSYTRPAERLTWPTVSCRTPTAHPVDRRIGVRTTPRPRRTSCGGIESTGRRPGRHPEAPYTPRARATSPRRACLPPSPPRAPTADAQRAASGVLPHRRRCYPTFCDSSRRADPPPAEHSRPPWEPS